MPLLPFSTKETLVASSAVALFTVLLGATAFTKPQAPLVFNPAELKRYSEQTPYKIFEHPRMSCEIRELLGPDHFTQFRTTMQLISLIETEREGSSFVFLGRERQDSSNTGILIIEPHGKIWAAFSDGQAIKYFTRSPEQPLPKAIEKWRTKLAGDVTFMRPGKQSGACTEASTLEAVRKFEAIERKETCDAALVTFSPVRAALVMPDEGNDVAYLHSWPTKCVQETECSTRTNRGLRRYDLVLLPSEDLSRNGLTCVLHRGPSGARNAGWVPDRNLNQDIFAIEAVDSPMPQPARRGWTGDWKKFSGRQKEGHALKIKQLSKDRLQLTGTFQMGSDRREFQLVLKVTGNVGEGAELDGRCKLRVRLLRNALYLEEGGGCGKGFSFSGTYFPTRTLSQGK